VQVTGLTSGVTAVSVGALSTCVITAGGSVKCWGDNSYGELGNASTTQSVVPVQVTGLTSGVTAVSVGSNFACAITASGGVECWGSGALGNNSDAGVGGTDALSTSLVPVQVTGLTSGVSAVSVGGYSACAITAGGGVECWGLNTEGELGNNSTASSSVPVQVTGLTSGVTAVSVGGNCACAVTAGGGIDCWGGDVAIAKFSLVPGSIPGF
jgi:alpha-tubulin suppressor-like RCC1 family protein